MEDLKTTASHIPSNCRNSEELGGHQSAGDAAAEPLHGAKRSVPAAQFLRSFSNAVNIAAMANCVVESASEASYRSFLADNLARETLRNYQAVDAIARDVCQTAVAVAHAALEACTSGASLNDAFASYAQVRRPPLSYRQFRRVIRFAKTREDGIENDESVTKQGRGEEDAPLHQEHHPYHSSTPTTASEGILEASQSASRHGSPDKLADISTSSCSSLPSLPGDKTSDEDMTEADDPSLRTTDGFHHAYTELDGDLSFGKASCIELS